MPPASSVQAVPRTAPHRTVLPHCLLLLYALAIAYASLQPFGPWIPPPPGTPFFLLATTLPRYTRFDVLANALAYVPLGFFAALVLRRAGPWERFTLGLTAAAGLSFTMESLQMLLPPRDASVIDLLSNAVGGALGASFGVIFAYSPRMRQALGRARHRWFLGGRFGDLGLTLVLVWLVVQVNPGIPLFATMFDPSVDYSVAPVATGSTTADFAAVLIEAAHSAFQVLGVGLFLALLLRARRFALRGALLLLGAAALLKVIAAALLLNPLALQRWWRPGVTAGMVVGMVLLAGSTRLPRPAQVAIATVALLSSLLSMALAPELIFSRAPLGMFNATYGHLLNFNGLTHTVLLLWPVIASAFLFTLAGRPRWGAPG